MTNEERKWYQNLLKEEKENYSMLLTQYKKELNDLENHTGLAKVMSRYEIPSAISGLKNHIADLTNCLSNLETEIMQLE